MAGGASTETFAHSALFYRGRREYLAGTLPFIREGLAAGEPVAVGVPGPNLRLIEAELGSQAGAVHMVDMTEDGRNPGRIIPGVLRAFADVHPTVPVRIIGEPIWPSRSALEYPACVQHEALINLAFTGQAVTILCPYDASQLQPHVLSDACRTHPLIVDWNGRAASGDYAPDDVVAAYNTPLPAPPLSALTFTVDRTCLAKARHFAAEQAEQLGLAHDRICDLVQAVGELAANSIVHGGGVGTLHVWASGEHLVCEVSDAGHIADPLAGRRPVDRRQHSGRGLLLVNYLTDLVRTHSTPQGTTTRIHFLL